MNAHGGGDSRKLLSPRRRGRPVMPRAPQTRLLEGPEEAPGSATTPCSCGAVLVWSRVHDEPS